MKPVLQKTIVVISIIFGWLVGTYLVGIAVVEHFTSSGTVDMLDAREIQRALDDPTFTASYSWGGIVLKGQYWALVIPLLFSVVAFIITKLILKNRG